MCCLINFTPVPGPYEMTTMPSGAKVDRKLAVSTMPYCEIVENHRLLKRPHEIGKRWMAEAVDIASTSE